MDPVLIIGAGPAGAMAALLLARAGLPVTLIDAHGFPRDKVCGECLSPLGLAVLGRAGISLTRGVPLTHFALHAPSGRSATATLALPMAGLSRLSLDPLLIDAACAGGAVFLPRHRCEGLDPLRIRDLERNAIVPLNPAVILLADGKSALLEPHPAATGDLGIKAHFAGIDAPPGAIELFGLHGCYGGLAPIEAGLHNAAFSVPCARIRPDLDRLFAEFAGENPTLGRRLARARRVSAWKVCPLPRFGVRCGWPRGVIPLGNAAAALEPIGGEGMGLALRSAEIAAEAIVAAASARRLPDPAPVRRQFTRLWSLRRLACRTAALFVSRPGLCDVAVECLNTSEALAPLLLALTGKSIRPATR